MFRTMKKHVTILTRDFKDWYRSNGFLIISLMFKKRPHEPPPLPLAIRARTNDRF